MRDHHVYGNTFARLKSMRTSPRLENGVNGITAEEEDGENCDGHETKHSIHVYSSSRAGAETEPAATEQAQPPSPSQQCLNTALRAHDTVII